ncbi:MAG TPA: DUF1330 domain-containing protein [Burkholderiales bacterium]|nr:DUF1330 domain-containing protein [Burkholderiales bacterium]
MPAYLVALGNVKDPEAYEEYRKLAGPAIKQYDGRFLARGGKTDVLEGSFPGPRVVIVEFPSLERAKEWFNSPEYQAARQKRLAVADLNLIVVEGA